MTPFESEILDELREIRGELESLHKLLRNELHPLLVDHLSEGETEAISIERDKKDDTGE